MRKKILYLILAMFLSVSLFSQYNYFYGKNKVQKKKFNWKVAKTAHFDIHYYTKNEKLIEKIAIKAEAAYKKISLYLTINSNKSIPIIFYNTHIDFEMTHLFPGFMPMGIQAFAEPIGHRVVIHGDRPFDEFSQTLTHELGHIFEYLIWYGKTGKRKLSLSRYPLWVAEGFSEFISSKLDDFDEITVIDSIANGMIPELSKNLSMRNYTNRTPYDFGRMLYEFIDTKYGVQGVKKVLKFFRGGSFFRLKLNTDGRFFKMFDTTRKKFNYDYKMYLVNRFGNFIHRETPDEYSYSIGPDFPYLYTFGHKISPSGEMMAVLTVNRKKRILEIILISMKTGKIIKRITPGFTTKYDGIGLKFNPTDGISFTWDYNNERVAFFARKEFGNYLVIINTLSTKVEKMIKLKDIQSPSSPDFHPFNSKLYFTGINDFNSSIFSYDFKSGKIVKLTHTKLYIKSLNISPDGKKIVYSAKTSNSPYNLYLASIDALDNPFVLTDDDYDDITPSFSKISSKIYYSSNELEAYNIYSIDTVNKKKYRYTNVKTGNFFPIEIPGKTNDIAFTSFYKGVFSLYRTKVDKFLELNDIADVIAFKNSKLHMVKKDKYENVIREIGEYKPLKNISITGTPTVSFGLTTQGDFYGYTSVTGTDILGDQRLTLTLGSYYGYKNFSLTYLNLQNKLNYYLSAFSFSIPYYTSYNSLNHITIRKQYGVRSGIYLPFNRANRLEFGFSAYRQEENSDLMLYGVKLPYGQYFTGYAIPITVSLVNDSIYFSNNSPNRGKTYKISFSKYIKFSDSFVDAYTARLDYRKYLRLGANTTIAFRANAFYSGGKIPLLSWTGGGNTIRSSYFNSIVGTRMFFVNLEFRFPIIHLAATPLGLIGPVKGVFFFDTGGAWFKAQDYKFFESEGGLKLKDGLASYGFGLSVSLFGYPLHFDWVYKTNFKEKKYYGLNFWIGFEF